jgi:transcriptional regulator with XRE-family HTH domain
VARSRRRYELAQRRRAVGHTQESFAEQLGGIDRSTIVRWESGATEPLPYIRPKIARVLDISIDELASMLTGSSDVLDSDASESQGELTVGSTLRQSPLSEHVVPSNKDESVTHAVRAVDTAIPRGLSTAAHDTGEMFGLRRVLMGCIPDTRPATQLELTAAVGRAWDLFFAARFGEMERALPVALAQAYSAAEATTGEPRRQVKISLAQLLHAASNLLGYVAHEDLATVALIRADALAAESGDELTRAAIKGSQSWLFAKNGMFDHAVAYADQAATDIEPRLSTATPRHISVWGEVLCYAAFAASRTGDYRQARRYLRLCESAGSQLDDDYASRPEASNVFGRTSAASFGVVNEIAAEQPREALKLAAASVSCAGVPPVLRSRRLINVAHAQVDNGDNVGAVNTLHRACTMAPEFIGHIGLAHTLTSELLTRRGKQRLNGLLDVANHIGVPVSSVGTGH